MFGLRPRLLASIDPADQRSISLANRLGASCRHSYPPDQSSGGALLPVAPATRPAATVAATLASQSWGGLVGSSGSAEQPCLGRRPARRQSGSLGLSGFRIQVREEVNPWVTRLWEERPQRYSRALLETLALGRPITINSQGIGQKSF